MMLILVHGGYFFMAKSANITFDSQVRTLALKFYVEQLMPAQIRQQYTELLAIEVSKNASIYQQQDALIKSKQIEKIYCEKFFKMIEDFHYKDYKICTIYHDKDTTEKAGSPFLPACKKGHWHVLIWRDSWRAPKKRFRVQTIINKLSLNYAPNLDTKLWKEHGAEQIKSSVANYVTYLPHNTEEAIDDGKFQYSISEIAKNFSDDELNEIFKYYEKTRKKTAVDWDELDREAVEKGLQVKDFSEWIKTKLNVSQRASANFKVIHRDYEDALEKGVKRIGQITRCSILITGAGNLGKTYTSSKTFRAMGLKTYEAPDGSGKYDNLSALHEAMIFNDTGIADAKKVFDNYPVILHRRNSDDRPWCGRYAVVTTNDSVFDAICGMIGVRYARNYDELIGSDKTHYNAVAQRLYFCHIDTKNKELVMDKAQERGMQKSIDEHDKMFIAFKNEFDIQLQTYDYTKPVSKLEEAKKQCKNKKKALEINRDPTILSQQELKNIVQLNQEKQVNSGSINPF